MPRGAPADADRRDQEPSRKIERGGHDNKAITEREAEDIEERSAPRTPVIYEVVRRMGEEEMDRPVVSLWWSGVAAGLSISFSLLSQTILVTHLPDAPWRPLVASFGYSVGFLMVVLARQQLFTENTITVVLPVMAAFTWHNLLRLARLWSVVFVANMAGTLFAALFCTFTPVLSPELRDGMLEVSRQGLAHDWIGMLFTGISSGFIIAAMVWLLPSAEGAQFHVITLMTWMIAAGGFTHVVAGSVEAFMLVANGELGIGRALLGFTLPVGLGNIIGGTALFSLISYAQVMQEIGKPAETPHRAS